ncbi:hypothetical protein CB1_000146005 [Camelus ferus]|nr:hypothetical protein CB1_000146005 [Camelus ferus]
MVKQLENGEVNIEELTKNLEYKASLLEAVYIDETQQILDTEDELQELRSDVVPSENLDLWCFDVFSLNRAADDHALRTIVFELLTQHTLISHFKIHTVFLMTFLDALETVQESLPQPDPRS